MKKIFTAFAATTLAFVLSLVIGTPARAAMPAASNPLYGTISRSCNTVPTVWYSNDWMTVTRTYLGSSRWQYTVKRSLNRTVIFRSHPYVVSHIGHDVYRLDRFYKTGHVNRVQFVSAPRNGIQFWDSAPTNDFQIFFKVSYSDASVGYYRCSVHW